MTKQSGFYWDLQGIQWKQYLGQVGEMYLKQNSQLSLHHLVTWLRNVTGPSQPQGSQRGHPGTHGLWLVGIFGLFSSLFDITGLKLLKSFLKILEKKKKNLTSMFWGKKLVIIQVPQMQFLWFTIHSLSLITNTIFPPGCIHPENEPFGHTKQLLLRWV